MKILYVLIFFIFQTATAQVDLTLSTDSPAGFKELQIPSHGSLMQGFMYKANGKKPHPTLLLLHGFPGNERNLDLAQAVRAHGWNVIYFNYRGSWGSQGEFSFKNCVDDVKSVVEWCKQNAVKMEIDPSRIALFGHSMGGFVCLKALQEIPGIQKGFALSAWDIYKEISMDTPAQLAASEKEADDYFVLNKRSGKALFAPVTQDAAFHNLKNAVAALSNRQLIMLDEHKRNEALANTIKAANKNYFVYEVWATDHSFTNKRASLIKRVIALLDK
jgi:acetyl esterase/lipase